MITILSYVFTLAAGIIAGSWLQRSADERARIEHLDDGETPKEELVRLAKLGKCGDLR